MIFENIFPKFDMIVAIVFGLIASILTLVGLISIFVSLNSHHKIQKCRELYWSLLKPMNRQDLLENLHLYESIFHDKERFTTRVIEICRLTIYFVIIITVGMNIISITRFKWYEYLIVTIFSSLIWYLFIKFAAILQDLKQVDKVSSLPSFHNLLNADFTEKKLNTVFLAATTLKSKLYIFYTPEKGLIFQFYLGTFLPLKNVTIRLCSMEFGVKKEDYPIPRMMLDAQFDHDQNLYILDNEIGLTPEQIAINQRIRFSKENNFDLHHMLENDRFDPKLMFYLKGVPFDISVINSLKIHFQIEGHQGVVDAGFTMDISEMIKTPSDYLNKNAKMLDIEFNIGDEHITQKYPFASVNEYTEYMNRMKLEESNTVQLEWNQQGQISAFVVDGATLEINQLGNPKPKGQFMY